MKRQLRTAGGAVEIEFTAEALCSAIQESIWRSPGHGGLWHAVRRQVGGREAVCLVVSRARRALAWTLFGDKDVIEEVFAQEHPGEGGEDSDARYFVQRAVDDHLGKEARDRAAARLEAERAAARAAEEALVRTPSGKELLEQLRVHDWYYNFSDDGRVWRAGSASEKKLLDIAHRAAPSEARQLWGALAPPEFPCPV